jgi:hypothetical protein
VLLSCCDDVAGILEIRLSRKGERLFVHDTILDWTYSQERSFARTDRRKTLSLGGLGLRTWMDWTDRPKS